MADQKMNRMISINKIKEPIHFANGLIDFFLENLHEIKISIYGKIESKDLKSFNGLYKTPFIRKFIFKEYSFKRDQTTFHTIKTKLEKYFNQDWGIIINRDQKGLFSFKMNNYFIDIDNNNKPDLLLKLFDSFTRNNKIDYFEISEDDYIDPYYENKETK